MSQELDIYRWGKNREYVSDESKILNNDTDWCG